MPPQPGEHVIWINVAKPTFDLGGVLVSSLGITGILVGIALGFGLAIGLSLIWSRRREAEGSAFDLRTAADSRH
jgi:hypothetical protein